MNKLLYYLIIFLFILFPNISIGKIEIKYKIGDEIITNIDILNEKIIYFFKTRLKNISDKEIIKIAKNSLIREIIKKKN